MFKKSMKYSQLSLPSLFWPFPFFLTSFPPFYQMGPNNNNVAARELERIYTLFYRLYLYIYMLIFTDSLYGYSLYIKDILLL